MTPVLVNITSSSGNQKVHIEIIDAVSHCIIASVEMSHKQFALGAVGSLGNRPAMAEFRFANLGKVSEHKEAFVPEDTPPAVHESWVARMDDFGNRHKRTKTDGKWGYNVSYFRYVEPTAEERERILHNHEAKMAEEEKS